MKFKQEKAAIGILIMLASVFLGFIAIASLGGVDENGDYGTGSNKLPGGYSTATGDDILLAYLKGWELADWVVTDDGKQYICYTDYPEDDIGDRNYGPGVCHKLPEGTYQHIEEYKAQGIDIASGEYDDVDEDMLDVEIVDNVFMSIVENRYMQTVLNSTEGYTLTTNQLHALTAVAYQYGNVDGAADFLASGGTDRDAFWVTPGYKPFSLGGGKCSDDRVEANWQLFSEGIYQIRSGEILDPANFGGGEQIKGTGDFKKYELTDSQLQDLAYLCVCEQGESGIGVAAEASLMANLFEIEVNDNGTGTDLYNYVRYGTEETDSWFAYADEYMGESVEMPEYIKIVKDVLVNGRRTIPGYIVEHDWLGDITSVNNNGTSFDPYDLDSYIPFVTEIKTVWGATYTFYSFPDPDAYEPDPFGYESESLRQEIGDAYYDFNTGKLKNAE